MKKKTIMGLEYKYEVLVVYIVSMLFHFGLVWLALRGCSHSDSLQRSLP